MEKISIKKIVLISVISLIVPIFFGCPTDPAQLTSAIFSGVEKINISTTGTPSALDPSSDSFTYDLSGDISFAILELFDGHISIPDDPDNKVPLENLVAGSRTGLNDFTRSSVQVDRLFPVYADNSDFDTSSNYNPGTGNLDYTWILLGYDENMILTHASTAMEVIVNWP